jgi:hypothetical protein
VDTTIVALIKEFIETGALLLETELQERLTSSRKRKAYKWTDDLMPEFLEALDELVDLYEQQNDFRASGLKKASSALEGHTVYCEDDIEMYKLHELKLVGSSTLEMLKDFINTGKIQRLESTRAHSEACAASKRATRRETKPRSISTRALANARATRDMAHSELKVDFKEKDDDDELVTKHMMEWFSTLTKSQGAFIQ